MVEVRNSPEGGRLTGEKGAAETQRLQYDSSAAVRLEMAGWVQFTPDYRGESHSHSYWELIYIRSGKGTLLHLGSIRECGPDQFFLVAPGESHQLASASGEGLEQLYIGFSFETEGAGMRFPGFAGLNQDWPLAELIRAELRRVDPDSLGHAGLGPVIYARLICIVSRLVVLMLSDSSGESWEGRSHDEEIVKAKDFISANLGMKVSVDSVAREVCMSAQYFGHVFKRKTGLSVKEFQTNLRMVKARELLREGTLSIAEIASAVGIDDPAYFCRVFKIHYQMPPRRMRMAP